jgi:hypothetical protein
MGSIHGHRLIGRFVLVRYFSLAASRTLASIVQAPAFNFVLFRHATGFTCQCPCHPRVCLFPESGHACGSWNNWAATLGQTPMWRETLKAFPVNGFLLI